MRILYVEDDPAHIELARRALETSQVDFTLDAAGSIKEALAGLVPQRYDVILCDYRLPDGSGLDLIEAVLEVDTSVAIVIITNQGDDQIATTAIKSGAMDYMVKRNDYLNRLPVVLTNAISQMKIKGQQKALHESEEKFRSLVEKIPAVVFMEDASDERITRYYSPRIFDLLGYTAAEWVQSDALWRNSLHPDDKERVIGEDHHSDETGEPFRSEYRLSRKDGGYRWVREDAHLVRDEHGRRRYWQGILLDVTEEKIAAEAIRQSEEKFMKIFQSSPIAICITQWDDGMFVDVNEAYCVYTGFAREELVGRLITDVTNVDLTARKSFLEHLDRSGQLEAMEDEIAIRSGEKRLALAFYEIIQLGQQRCILSMLYDITDQKKTLDALQKRDAILGAVGFAAQQFLQVPRWRDGMDIALERLGDASSASRVYVFQLGTDDEGAIYTNQLYEWTSNRVLPQINRRKLNNEPVLDSCRGSWIDVLNHDQVVVRHWEDYSPQEKELLDPQGIFSFVLVPVFVEQKLWGYIGYDECVNPDREWHPAETEALSVAGRILGTAIHRELSEKALQTERDFARNILNTMTQGLTVTRADDTLEYVNPALANILGRTPDDLLGLRAEDISSPANYPVLDREGTLRKEGITSSYKMYLKHKNGDDVPVGVTASPRWVDGRIAGAIAVVTDLTEQEHAERALRASEASYTDLFNAITEAIYILDRKGSILDVNSGAVGMHAHPSEFFLGKKFETLGAPNINLSEKINAHFVRAFDGDPQQFEFWGLRANGEIFPQDIHFYSGTYFGQSVVIALAQDITDRKLVEKTMLESNSTLQRQLQELIILHEVALAGERGDSENEIIDQAIKIVAGVYSEVCGILLLNEKGDRLIPHPSYFGVDISGWKAGFPSDQGITGKSVTMGRAVIVADITKEPGYIEIASVTRSELSVPIRVHERVIGVMNVESREVGKFDNDDERFLSTIAGGLGSALERVRLLETKQAQLKREASIVELMRIAASSLDLDSVLQSILTHLLSLIPSDSGSIQILEKDNLRLAALNGLDIKYIAANNKFHVTRFPVNEAVITQKKVIYIADVKKDDRYVQLPGLEQIHSFLAVPLIFNDRAIGMVTLDSFTTSHYSKEDEELAVAIADHIAVAIENARLYGEEKKRSKLIETLAEITNKIATSRVIMPVLDDIVKQGVSLLNASHMAVYLLQDDNQTLKIVSAEGRFREQLLSHTIIVGQGITGSVVLNKKTEIVNDFSQDQRTFIVPRTPKDDTDKEVMMSAPLLLRDTAIGAINAWRIKSDGSFDEVELNFLVSLAHQISVAIESSRLFDETVRRAQEAAAMAEVGRGISETLQLNVVMERIASYAKDLLRAETSAVYVSGESETSLYAIAAFGLDVDEIKSYALELGNGILGNIAINKVGEIVNNTEFDPRTVVIDGTQQNPHEHIMGVPVLFKEILVGLIVVWRSGKELEFKPHELDFLTGLAQQAAIAIENARLYDETHRQLEEQEIISRISYAMRAAKDPDEMLPVLLIETKRILNTDSVSIWLYDSKECVLVQKLASGIFVNTPKSSFQSGEGIVGHVFATGEPYISKDLFNDPLANRDNVSHFGPGWSGMIVPIQARTKTIGGMAVALQAPRQIKQNHEYILSTIAEIAGNSIHRAELYENSQRQVQHLTTLREIDSAIASSFDLKMTLNILLDYMLKEMGVGAAAIFEYLPAQHVLAYLSGRGFHKKAITQIVTSIGLSLSGDALIDRKDVYIADLSVNDDFIKKYALGAEGFASYYAVPLISKGQSKGVLEAYFRTPFTPSPDWVDFLRTLAGQATIAIDNSNLFDNLQRSNQELEMAYDTTLEGWGKALELRDKETQGHTRRVTDLTLRLARQMNLPDEQLVHIHRGALLHDIGKMGVPDHILRKEGPLTQEEWTQMRQHPQNAYDLLSSIQYLQPALDIPYSHHEWWDGTGYPRGLKGEAIPLAARIFAVVDVWDALLSDRPYRTAWSREKVIEHMQAEAGTHFDPEIVRNFLSMMENN